MVIVARYSNGEKKVITDKVKLQICSLDGVTFTTVAPDVVVIVLYSEKGDIHTAYFTVDVIGKNSESDVGDEEEQKEEPINYEWEYIEPIAPTATKPGYRGYQINKTLQQIYDMQGNLIPDIKHWLSLNGDGYIPPLKKRLTSIELTKSPDKYKYHLSDSFNPTGMKVIAHYDDGSSQEIKNYNYDNRKFENYRRIDFTLSDFNIFYKETYTTISYTEGDITVSTNVYIELYRDIIFWI